MGYWSGRVVTSAILLGAAELGDWRAQSTMGLSRWLAHCHHRLRSWHRRRRLCPTGRRDRRPDEAVLGAVWRVAAIGIALVLISVVVYLPGVLTAVVTTRSNTAIANDDYMGVDLSGLLSSTIATAYPMMPSWWWEGLSAPAPALYIAWFLPLVAFLSWRRIRAFAPRIRDILFFAALSLGFVLLPATVGPLRYPARFMPYLALVCVLLCVVLVSQAYAKVPSKLSLLGATGAIAFGAYVGWAKYPDRYRTVFVTGSWPLRL